MTRAPGRLGRSEWQIRDSGGKRGGGQPGNTGSQAVAGKLGRRRRRRVGMPAASCMGQLLQRPSFHLSLLARSRLPSSTYLFLSTCGPFLALFLPSLTQGRTSAHALFTGAFVTPDREQGCSLCPVVMVRPLFICEN